MNMTPTRTGAGLEYIPACGLGDLGDWAFMRWTYAPVPFAAPIMKKNAWKQ